MSETTENPQAGGRCDPAPGSETIRAVGLAIGELERCQEAIERKEWLLARVYFSQAIQWINAAERDEETEEARRVLQAPTLAALAARHKSPNTKLSGGGPLSNQQTEAESRRSLDRLVSDYGHKNRNDNARGTHPRWPKEILRPSDPRPERPRKGGRSNPALRAMRLRKRKEVQVLLPRQDR